MMAQYAASAHSADSAATSPHNVSVTAESEFAATPVLSLRPAAHLQCRDVTAQATGAFLVAMTQGKANKFDSLTGCRGLDWFTLRLAPAVCISRYVTAFSNGVGLPPSALVVACAYLRRLAAAPCAHRHADGDEHAIECEGALHPVEINPCNIHRLFAACVVLATKYVSDRVHSMQYYAAHLRLTPDDLRRLEGQLCEMLGFNLFVRGDEFTAAAQAIATCGTPAPTRVDSPMAIVRKLVIG